MIKRDKIYIININDLSEVKSFSIKENTAEMIADYFLDKKIDLHLICRPGYRSITLKSWLHTNMIKEIQEWLEEE
jgi:hypothetical protein